MKDTFFFPHDFGARNDPKLQNVLMEYGCEGLGVFWCVVEQIYEQGGSLPLANCKSIAFALHVDCKVVESVVKDFNLFGTDGEIFWSESINKRLAKRAEIAEKRKNAAFHRWNKPQNNANAGHCNANAQSNNANAGHCNANAQSNNANAEHCNANAQSNNANAEHCNAIKGKERKGKERKGKNSNKSIDVDSSSEDDNDKQGKSSIQKEKIDFEAIVELYHKCCPSFPRIIQLSNSRKTKVKIRFAEMKNDLSLLESVFNAMEKSKFLRGENKNGWQASFDWVFDNGNWLKVIEGNYNDKTGGNSKNVNDIWDNQ